MRDLLPALLEILPLELHDAAKQLASGAAEHEAESAKWQFQAAVSDLRWAPELDGDPAFCLVLDSVGPRFGAMVVEVLVNTARDNRRAPLRRCSTELARRVARGLVSPAAAMRKHCRAFAKLYPAELAIAGMELRPRMTPAEQAMLDAELAAPTGAGDRRRTLSAALEAWEAGDVDACVGELVAVWQDCHDLRVESVIVAASAGAAPFVPPKKSSLEEREAAWTRQWATSPSTRGRLLEVPWPSPWKLGMARANAIFADPDPRGVTAALLISPQIYSSSGSAPFWRTLGKLAAHADSRHSAFWHRLDEGVYVPLTPPILAAPLREPESGRVGTRWALNPVRSVAPAKRGALPEAAPVAEAALVELAARVGRGARPAVARGDLDALLMAVYEAPDDDEVRRVYADALSAVRDPRGEFIALQLQIHHVERSLAGDPWDDPPAPPDLVKLRKVASALLNKHIDAWTAPLSGALLKDDREFERGFLVGGTWRGAPEPQHAAWRLVRRLSGSWTVNPANLVSLRALYTHDAAAIPDALAARLTELGLYVPHFDFRAMERFPALRTIVPDCFINEPVPADLFGRVPQAERWVLPPQRERLPGIMHMKAGNVRVLVTGAPGLSPGFRVGPVTTLRPSSDGCLRRVEISWEGGPLGFGGWVAGAFRHLDDVEALVVKRSPRFKPHVVAAIEVELTRLGGRWG